MTHSTPLLFTAEALAAATPSAWPRRNLLVLGTALAGAGVTAATPSTATTQTPALRWFGKPGEFDWLTGEWRIANRRRLADGRWDEFGGEATCFSILGGVVHVEELRIPERHFSGMGLRTLNVESGLWSDYWVNAVSGVLGEAGLTGGFEAGIGIFDSEVDQDGQRVRHRGQWDLITPRSCRWQQMSSRDGGQSWDVNWSMAWTRVRL